MKSTLKMSLVLVALLLTFSLLLTGCGQEEINVKIDDNAAKAQTAVNDAAKKAHDDLASAVAKLEALVNSGNTASAASLTEAVAELNAAIEAAKTAATGADASLKAALEAAIAAAKTEAVTASQSALDAAKAELEAADLANAADVVAKVKVLNDAIAAATDAAGNAIANLKEELTIAIASAKKDALDAVADSKDVLTAALEAAVKKLEAADAAITGGDATTIAALVSAKNEAVTAIGNLQTLINGVDQAAKDGIKDTLAAAKAYTDEVVKNTLAAYDSETANVILYLDALEALRDELVATKDWYASETYDDLMDLYDDQWVYIMRAARVGDAQKAYEVFEVAYETADSIIDTVYEKLIALKADIKEIQDLIDAGDNAAAVEALKALKDAASYTDLNTLYEDAVLVPGAATEMADYTSKDESVKNYNIVDQWAATKLAYSRIIGTVGGALVKADMDVVNATLITPTNSALDADMVQVRADFEEWAQTAEVNLADGGAGDDYIGVANNFVDGFEAAITKFIACENRMAELKLAKAEAEAAATGFIDRIEAIRDAIALTGATNTNKTTLDNIKADLFAATTGWVARYKLEAEKALYDADNETAEAPNYKMFGPANLAAAEEEFEDAFETQNAAFADFRDAAEAIIGKPVSLMMYDEINKALDLYDLFKVKTGADTFDMIFTDGEGNPIDPKDYFNLVTTMKGEYNTLRATATTAYNAAFDTDYKALTVNNINIYTTDLVDVRNWFDTYVKNKMFQTNAFVEGYNFDNNDEKSGYALNDSITVTKADYDNLVKLEAVLKALTDAKTAETEGLVDDVTALAANLDAVNSLTTKDQATIEALAARRQAWEAGRNATAIVVPGYEDVALVAAQYAIADPAAETTYEFTNRDILLAAETRLTTLLGLIDAAQTLIDALDAFTVSTDFADQSACDTYKAALEAIDTALTAFDNANKNVANYDNRFAASDLAMIEDGKLAVRKFNDLAAFKAGALNTATIAVGTDAYALAALETIADDIVDLVDAVEVDADRAAAKVKIAALIDVAEAQVDGVVDAYNDYVASIGEVDGSLLPDADKATTKASLAVAYERALTKIAEGYNTADGFVTITNAAQVTNLVTTLVAEFDVIIAEALAKLS